METKDKRLTPEAKLKDLRKKPEEAKTMVMSSNWKVQLTYDDGVFILKWSATNIGSNDFIGLYRSDNASDDNYISGAWQYASKGSSYKTSQVVINGYQARYLVYDSSLGKYISKAKTDPFPFIKKCSPPLNNRQICLSPKNGRFHISWKSGGYSPTDFVALYPNTIVSDANYIGGTKVMAQSPPWSFDTAIPVQSGYEARFVVQSGSDHITAASTGAYDTVTVYSNPVTYPRKPTTSEWSSLIRDFPNLTKNNVWVTAPSTPRGNTPFYNCIAWSLGLDDRWINPNSPLSAFKTQYETWGQKPESALFPSADIDAWGTSTYNATHGSKTYAGQYLGISSGLWESKLGQSLRITHGRRGLNSTVYGRILASFTPGFAFLSEEVRTLSHVKPLYEMNMSILKNQLKKIPKKTRSEFENAFYNWQETWFTGDYKFSSDTKDFAQGEAFLALVDMGDSIIPLVLEKLQDPGNFVALVLYDTIQANNELVITYEKGDLFSLEGEHARAKRTIAKWMDSCKK